MIDAQPSIAFEGIAPIFPERVNTLFWMKRPDRIRPTLCNQLCICFSNFGPKQSVVAPALRRVVIEIGRHNIEIASERYGYVESQQLSRIIVQPLKPAELVLEFGPRNGIAVRKIERAD